MYLATITFGAYKGIPVAQQEAKKWLLPAAENGRPKAQFMLGRIFEEEENFRLAAYWYLKAAIQNMPEAQNNFAVLYSKGLGIERNPKEAYKWFKKAADLGNRYAQYTLGYGYISGEVLPKDIDQGVAYQTKSALQDNQFAQGYLALLYFKGEIIPRDLVKSKYWALQAKKNNDIHAQTVLTAIDQEDKK